MDDKWQPCLFMIKYFVQKFAISSKDGINFIINLFSSPEHEALLVSYCDQSMSVVRRPSFVVNNLF